MHGTIEGLLEAVFSLQSMLRLYDDHLALPVSLSIVENLERRRERERERGSLQKLVAEARDSQGSQRNGSICHCEMVICKVQARVVC